MNPDHTGQQAEERIERVLTALREARPAPDMEQRMRAALLRQADESSSASPRWTWLRKPQFAGLAAILAAALLLSVAIERHIAAPSAKNPSRGTQQLLAENAAGYIPRNPEHSTKNASRSPLNQEHLPEKAAGSTPLNPEHPTENASRTPLNRELLTEKAAGFSPLNPASTREGLQPRRALTGAKAPLWTGPHIGGLKATALSKTTMRATPAGRRSEDLSASVEQGFPAPPLPLTEQERLLVRLVHRDDPVQLAQFTPGAREAELKRDREQLREFFKAPPMLAANFTLEPYPTAGGTQ